MVPLKLASTTGTGFTAIAKLVRIMLLGYAFF